MSIRNSAEPRRLQAHLRLVPPEMRHSSSDAASPHDTKTSSARRFLAALLSQEEAGTAIYGSRLPHPPPPRAKGFLSLLSPQSGYPVAQLSKGCPSLGPFGFRLSRVMPVLPIGATTPLAACRSLIRERSFSKPTRGNHGTPIRCKATCAPIPRSTTAAARSACAGVVSSGGVTWSQARVAAVTRRVGTGRRVIAVGFV
jgi:hypothetical protein